MVGNQQAVVSFLVGRALNAVNYSPAGQRREGFFTGRRPMIQARRAKFIMRLNPQADWGIGHRIVWRIGEDRNDGGTIVILPILPIPNDTAVFGLRAKPAPGLHQENVARLAKHFYASW
jgi:hypothetical protein